LQFQLLCRALYIQINGNHPKRTICVSQISATKSTRLRHTLRNFVTQCNTRIIKINYSLILTQFIAKKFISCSYFQIKCPISVSVIAWKCSFNLVGLLADLTVHFETQINRLVRLFIGLISSFLAVDSWLLGSWPPLMAHILYTKI